MGYQELVLGKEAESISGVSLTTLSRFVDAGYLQVEVDSEGVPWYSKTELLKLFKLDGGVNTVPATEIPSPAKAQIDETEIASVREELETASEPASSDELTTPVAPASEPLAILSAAAPTIQDDAMEASRPETGKALAEGDLRAELSRQKHLLELHERLLELREKQIADLKEQRDWLQKRVERFEEKSERDQILLVSETQTIRKLISLQEERKSNLRLALEWLGLAKPHESRKVGGSAFIDVTSEKQRDTANA